MKISNFCKIDGQTRSFRTEKKEIIIRKFLKDISTIFGDVLKSSRPPYPRWGTPHANLFFDKRFFKRTNELIHKDKYHTKLKEIKKLNIVSFKNNSF